MFGWLKAGSGGARARLSSWHLAWRAALEAPDETRLDALESQLEALGLAADDTEIEREMLVGLRELLALRAAVDTTGLPVVETGHRAIGRDVCHFSAPASMPDDAAQPSGRLLLAGNRAVFVGGARSTTVPWHAVAETRHADRDVVLIRRDRQDLYRFRCNSFADAICGAFLAQRLTRQSQTTRRSSS